ncbi:MAG: alpha/beta hydrolase, partial [Actinobacteria bacterium]|nr:alpha/beta hydrolase [Actinomycetota bacterium]
ARFAELWWHWFFFSSPHAERVITADPLAWYRPDASRMGEENYNDFVAALSLPGTVRAMVSDYRAGLHVDREADEADRRDGRIIRCPTLVAWSRHDDMELLYGNPAAIWADWCADTPWTAVIDSGHHMAEEAPHHVAEVLERFLSRT